MPGRHVLLHFCLAGCLWFPAAANAQSPSPPAFDVSTVKPHDPADQSMSWRVNQDGFSAMNVVVTNLAASAWGVRADQITGAPAWTEELHWDVTGKTTELSPEQLRGLSREQRAGMMQRLLADRFHLRAHLETRTGPIYFLLPAKGGIKLTPVPMTAEEKAAGGVRGGGLSMSGDRATEMVANKITLATLLGNLALNMHQTVVDKTGLPADAVYSFKLHWLPDYGTAAPVESDALPLPAALQEQLGLHVEAGKGPVEVLVIDHVEKPTEN